MNPQAAMPAEPPPGGKPADGNGPAPRSGPVKFLYAGGSRPLDGFVIKRGIGRGGFGEVYFATSDAGKEVALKHVERNLDVELRGVGQCLNLKHNNLVDLYDVKYDDHGEAWVVMEYIAGPNLKDVLDRNPNGLPAEQVEYWFQGLAAGVIYLHEHGLVHRDLKPGNIFDDGGVVKIGDYGLSKFISCSRKSGQTESVGTFHYMAPEIGKGSYGKEIDVYALGVMLYELLTGRVPFEGESSQEIIMKHLTADPDLAPIPPGYRPVIARALAKDPERRYSSVREMLAAFPSQTLPAAVVEALPNSAKAAQTAPRSPANGKSPRVIYIGDEAAEMQFGPVKNGSPTLAPRSAGKAAAPAPAKPPAEPMGAAMRVGWGRFSNWWNQGLGSTLLKSALILGFAAVACVAMARGSWLAPVFVALGAVYVAFLGVRSLIVALQGPRDAPPPSQPSPKEHYSNLQPANSTGFAGARDRRHGSRAKSWEEQGRQALQMRTVGEQVGELSGSLLAAALICIVLGLVALVISGVSLPGSVGVWTFYAWFVSVTTVASWAVLAAGKFWEGSVGEPAKRRFVQLVLGLAVGAFAFVAAQLLMIETLPLPGGYRLSSSSIQGSLTPSVYQDGLPGLPAYLAFFGAIFLTLAWWKQTDPLRSSRLQIGTLLVTVIVALLWQLAWPLPDNWGCLLLGSVSIAVQLSSLWLNPQERAAIRQNMSPS
jgi:hypothetical protein